MIKQRASCGPFRVAKTLLPPLCLAAVAAGLAACERNGHRSPADSGDGPAPSPAATAQPGESEGFVTVNHGGHQWVFRAGSEDLTAFTRGGALPEKHVTRVVATRGTVQTLKSPDREILDAYLATGPDLPSPGSEAAVPAGFMTGQRGNHLWVFREGSEAAAKFAEGEVPADHVTKMWSTGSGVRTLKSADRETIDAYLATGR